MIKSARITIILIVLFSLLGNTAIEPVQAEDERDAGDAFQQAVMDESESITRTPHDMLNQVECTPNSGYMWVNGPADPQASMQVQQELSQLGVDATVEATSYGEIDDCGTYNHAGLDITIILTETELSAQSNHQETVDDVNSALAVLDEDHLGNVTIADHLGTILPLDTNESPTELQPLNDESLPPDAITKKVYVIVYDPLLSNGQTLSEYRNWNDHALITQETINSFKQASNNKMNFTVVETTIFTDGWPELIDGFSYSEEEYLAVLFGQQPHHEPTTVDYNVLVNDPEFDICGKANRNEIDEVWVYNAPWFGFYESRLVGPAAYWYNSPPIVNDNTCTRLIPIMGPSVERTTREAVHNFTHRAEATMTKVYGSWAQNRTSHSWDKFGLVKGQSPSYTYSGCGSSHFPPNSDGVTAYIYNRLVDVPSNCDDFFNYPNLGDPLQVSQPISCSAWGCNELGYYEFWFNHFPTFPECGPDNVANDWWKYIAHPAQALSPSYPCQVGDYWITGNAGISGVTLSYTDGSLKAVTSDPSGNYAIAVSSNWSGMITPSKTNYTFLPASRSYANVTADINNDNYEAEITCPTITEWKGEYWSNATLAGTPALCRNDSSISFPWGSGSPDPAIPADFFSARWIRTIQFTDGLYRFRMSHDDGARLFIDDQLIIDAWGTCCVWDTIDVPLSGAHTIRMEMFENSGGAGAELLWQALAPEMDVKGNGLSIADGDNTPRSNDFTDFGATAAAGGTLSRTFSIHNSGTGNLNLTGSPRVEISGEHADDFTVTAFPASTTLPGGSAIFTVLFDPGAGGARSAVVSISNNDSNEHPYNFSIQGTGTTYPGIEVHGNGILINDEDNSPSLSDHTVFEYAPVSGVTASRTFTIHNTGDANLTLTGSKVLVFGTHASDFTITNQPASLIAPGESSAFTVVFDPSDAGLRSAYLNISNDVTGKNPYNFFIQGTGTTSSTFLRPVGIPRLSLPRRNSITNNAGSSFNWANVVNAENYEIMIATDNAFTQIVMSEILTSSTFTPSIPLDDGRYFWRVRAFNSAAQPGRFSLGQAFTIDTTAPAVPVLTSPMDTASLRLTPVFRWTRVPGAVLYEFQYDNDDNFSSPTYSVLLRINYRKPPAMQNGTHFWRVRARDTAGNWSEWSPAYSTTID